MISESTVRSQAKRAGYVLRKSRKHSLDSSNHGQFMLVDDRNAVALGSYFDASLEDVLDYLKGN